MGRRDSSVIGLAIAGVLGLGCSAPTDSAAANRQSGKVVGEVDGGAALPQGLTSRRSGLKDEAANRPRRAAAFWASFYTDVLRKCRATAERCDGRDNNCNGQVDEGC